MSIGCSHIVQSVGCLHRADGTKLSIIIHTEYGINAAGGLIVARTLYTDAASAPLALAPGDTVSPGLCPVNQRLTTRLYNLGGPSLAASMRPDGSTLILPANAQSVAVIALATGLPGAADRVDVTTATGTRTMRQSGESISWAVDGDGDRDLNGGAFTIQCFGSAYADVAVTVA